MAFIPGPVVGSTRARVGVLTQGREEDSIRALAVECIPGQGADFTRARAVVSLPVPAAGSQPALAEECIPGRVVVYQPVPAVDSMQELRAITTTETGRPETSCYRHYVNKAWVM